MGSEVETKHRIQCQQCRRAQVACLCQNLLPFETHTHFVILMHPMEARKEKVGTGRYTHLSLLNSRIIVGENFDHNEEVRSLLQDSSYDPYILYPGKNAISLDGPSIQTQKKLLIFIIDGTWASAKSMMRDSSCLHNLPRLSFNLNQKSNFIIKQQPSHYCLSTIESVYKVLEGLNRWEREEVGVKQHQNLLALLESMCKFQQACASDPTKQRYRSGNFKIRDSIKPSKKWQSRKIYFEVQ